MSRPGQRARVAAREARARRAELDAAVEALRGRVERHAGQVEAGVSTWRDAGRAAGVLAARHRWWVVGAAAAIGLIVGLRGGGRPPRAPLGSGRAESAGDRGGEREVPGGLLRGLGAWAARRALEVALEAVAARLERRAVGVAEGEGDLPRGASPMTHRVRGPGDR